MKKFLTVLCLVCVSTQAWAMSFSDWSWERGEFEVLADALYYRPSTCDLGFVIEDANVIDRFQTDSLVKPVGREVGPCPGYEWGFRIGVGYVVDCGWHDARLTYSRLRSSDTLRVAAPENPGSLWLTLGDATRASIAVFTGQGIEGFIQQRVAFNWDALDLEVATRLTSASGLELRYHFGLHWTDFGMAREVVVVGLSTFDFTGFGLFRTVTETSNLFARTWGVGPRIGFDGRYEILCGLGLSGHAGLGILGGELRVRTNQEARTVDLNSGMQDQFFSTAVTHRTKCTIFPELDMSLGLSYHYDFCCIGALLELGYEFRTYFDALTSNWLYMQFQPDGKVASCNNFNLSGLYLRVLLDF